MNGPGRESRRHVWMPGVEAEGGIQAYAGSFLRCLLELRPEIRHEVLLKNDRAAPPLGGDADVAFHVFGRVPGPLRSVSFAAGAVGALVRDRPDLLIVGHVHFGALSGRLCPVLGVPYWVLTYGLEAWSVTKRGLGTALRKAAKVVTISRYTAERISRGQGLDPDRIDLLPCTFDPDLFRPRVRNEDLMHRLGIGADQPVILTVARLAGVERDKGYDLVLEALPRIRRAIPEARYVLVGKGPDRPRIEARIRALGLEDAVILAGFVPEEDLPHYYNLCSAFVMPSRNEGFGIVYLEALGCGKPAIGGNRDGARDALLDGELGVLVDPEDAPGLAETVVGVLRGEHPREILYDPAALRRRVIEAYGPERFRSRLAELLGEAAP